MPFDQAFDFVKQFGKEIGRLSTLHDPLAMSIEKYYRELFVDRNNYTKRLSLMQAVTEFCIREVAISEQAELEGKFGHKTPDEYAVEQQRVVVPIDLAVKAVLMDAKKLH